MLSQIEQIFLFLMILFIMFGVGCSLTKNHFLEALEVKRSLVIGLSSQFFAMPCLAFIIVKILKLPLYDSIGLILVACTPGGSTSNLFTYFSRGHTALSVTMTVFSTLCSLFMMPFLLWFCLSSLVTNEIIVPYQNIFMALSIVIIPVLLGFYLRVKKEDWALKAEKISGYCSLAVVFAMIAIWIPKFYGAINMQNSQKYLAIVLLNISGLLFGFFLANIGGLHKKFQKAIMFETGIQNAPLAFVIASLSFENEVATQIGWLPLTYGALSIGSGIFFTLIIRSSDLVKVLTNYPWKRP